jgi:hypothetical protein
MNHKIPELETAYFSATLGTKIQTFFRKQDVNMQMHIKADLDVWNSTMGMC